jgi:hypothetical protein
MPDETTYFIEPIEDQTVNKCRYILTEDGFRWAIVIINSRGGITIKWYNKRNEAHERYASLIASA